MMCNILHVVAEEHDVTPHPTGSVPRYASWSTWQLSHHQFFLQTMFCYRPNHQYENSLKNILCSPSYKTLALKLCATETILIHSDLIAFVTLLLP